MPQVPRLRELLADGLRLFNALRFINKSKDRFKVSDLAVVLLNLDFFLFYGCLCLAVFFVIVLGVG